MSTPRKRITKEVGKKQCQGQCKKLRTLTFFFKVDSPLFPDGSINICRDCVRAQVDVENMEQIVSFLRQIDKPFIQNYWDEAKLSKNHPLGEYIRKINSLQQMKGKTFEDSGFHGLGKTSEVVLEKDVTVRSEKGELIEFNDDLIFKWGANYSKHEYLQMEKFYIDMSDSHTIVTPIHKSMLSLLAKLSIKMVRYLEKDNMPDFEKANRQFEASMKSAGFRPVDKQGLDDATGIKSFAQIFEEVEKNGFRKPPVSEFEEDIVDQMIVSLLNYYHRIVGKPLLDAIPQEISDELSDFYEDDLTPVDIDDAEYEDLDFSVDEDE